MADPLWRGAAPLLLASTSPTRRMLLESAGLPVETAPPGVDERAVAPDAAGPAGLARRLAREKALAVSRRRPDRVVVGADQTLDLDGEALHKPESLEGARRQLARLAGRRHVLHAGVCVARGGAVVSEFLDSAALTMRPLEARAIDAYLGLAGEGATRSVGCYELEGVGVHLFERVEGDHATILGLPLLPLLGALRGLHLLAF